VLEARELCKHRTFKLSVKANMRVAKNKQTLFSELRPCYSCLPLSNNIIPSPMNKLKSTGPLLLVLCRHDVTIDLKKYRWLGLSLMTGKLDWMLLRNFKVKCRPSNFANVSFRNVLQICSECPCVSCALGCLQNDNHLNPSR